MALQRQVVPTNFIQGVDTKTNPYLTTSFLSLVNCYQQKTGSIQKRFGMTPLSTNIIGSTNTITEGKSLFTYNSELLMHDGDTLYAYSNPNQMWSDVNELFTNRVTSSLVIANSYNQTIPDMGIAFGIALYAWQDSRGGVYVTAIDQSTGNIILGEQLLNSAYTLPKVVPCGDFLFVYAIKSTTTLVSVRFDPKVPTGFSSENTISNTVYTSSPIYDVITFSDNMVFAYANTANHPVVGYVTQNNVVGNSTAGLPSPVVYTAYSVTTAISVMTDKVESYISVAYANNTTGVNHFAVYPTTLAVYLTNQVIDSITSPTVLRITQITDGDNLFNGTITFLYEVTSAGGGNINTFIKTNTLGVAGNVPGTPTVFLLSVGLLSKMFQVANQFYVGVCYDTNAQATNFLVRATDGFIVSKFSYGLGGGILSVPNSVCHVSLSNLDDTLSPPDYTVAEFPTSKRAASLPGATIDFLLGVNKNTFDFRYDSDIESDQLGQNLHIGSGIIQAYDGLSTVELGFLLNPETLTYTTGLGILTGNYKYVVVWEWIDQAGQTHQSGPSPILTVNGLATNNVTLTIPTLRLTFKQAAFNRTNVLAVVYRTLANGTIFFRVTNYDTSILYNNPLADTITYADNATDASIEDNLILYTSEGVLKNLPAPAATLMHVFQNRLWLAGLENSNTLVYSQEYITEEGVAFPVGASILINESGGNITALGDLDDKLVVFKENAVYVIVGNGPDSSGQNGSFSIPQIISGEIGCTEPRTIAKIPQGLMFLSDKGIYLLDRALVFQYIGANVEAYNSYQFTGSAIVGDLNQARFTTLEGTTLVYDWYFKQWYTFTNQQADSCKIWKEIFIILQSNGVVTQEVNNTYNDGDKVITTSIQTGWYSFASLQGFQRVYSVYILGQYVGPHILEISSTFDFKTSPYETVSIVPASIIEGATYGTYTATPYGGNTYPYGGFDTQDGVYQFEYKLSRQKCESMQLNIQDLFPNNAPSGGFVLTGLTFVVGVKTGGQKTAAVRRLS